VPFLPAQLRNTNPKFPCSRRQAELSAGDGWCGVLAAVGELTLTEVRGVR
jgi:hypothetical protein